MRNIMTEDLKQLLTANKTVIVTFTKRDGTERNMLCTTNPELIEVKTFSKNSGGNEVAQSVWDLEKSAWRSFRWDSVISFKEAANG